MSAPTEKPVISNFIRNIIDDDIASNKWNHPVTTRFPPEPNGYLHYGHAKSICLNFGLARDYGGACHLRFDDTNPEKEEQEYVDSIIDAVRWLGFDWGDNQFFASDYFDKLYAYAEFLIEQGLAYVDSQDAAAMRENRGTHLVPGTNSPYRERTPAENLDLFRRMKAGEFADGAHVLRAKIDMASPNFNLRDPVIYRIRHAEHHRTGNTWCIYPLYDYTHCISDALEHITHSVCTLEFEDHRPLYDWVLDKLQPVIGW
ncbi:MAG: glutamate--tRNA ligase family protein, partial [Sulfuriferula sp.]